MSSSLKQLIVNAVIKVSAEDPAMNQNGGPTHEEARDSFIKLLLAELFPENSSVPSPKAKRAKKAAVAAEPVADITASMATLTVATPAAEVPLPASPTDGKKKRGPMTEAAKAAMKAKRDATIAAKKSPTTDVVEPAPVVEKKTPKAKKAAVPEDANLQKIDPTWRKHLKKAAGDKYAKEQEAELLTFLNALDKDAFNAKKAEDHVKDFLGAKPAGVVDDGKIETDLTVVDFNGKEYYVNPETKRVYEGQGEYDAAADMWTIMKPVGYAGMAAFAEMDLDD